MPVCFEYISVFHYFIYIKTSIAPVELTLVLLNPSSHRVDLVDGALFVTGGGSPASPGARQIPIFGPPGPWGSGLQSWDKMYKVGSPHAQNGRLAVGRLCRLAGCSSSG